MSRIQVIMDEIEREAFREAASREGITLSEWLRRAARDRLASVSPRRIKSVKELRAFFEACEAREEGAEPDWDDHRQVIEESKSAGKPTT